MNKITRRKFLKESALLSAGAAFGIPYVRNENKQFTRAVSSSEQLGRIFSAGAESYSEPDHASNIINGFQENDLLFLRDIVTTNSHGAGKSIWYLLDDGSYLPSTSIQPVKNQLTRLTWISEAVDTWLK